MRDTNPYASDDLHSLPGSVSSVTSSMASNSHNINPQDKCTCCPYGYHIDLDFLNFCRDVESGSTLRSLKRIQRTKRKLRKSMEIMLDEQEGCDPNSSQPDIVSATEAGRLMHMINYERSHTNRILNQIDTSVGSTIAGYDGRQGGGRHMSSDSSDAEPLTPMTPMTPYTNQYSHTPSHAPNGADDPGLFNRSSDSISSISSVSSMNSEAPTHRTHFHSQEDERQYNQQQREQQELQYAKYQQAYQAAFDQHHQIQVLKETTVKTEYVENPVIEMGTAEMKQQHGLRSGSSSNYSSLSRGSTQSHMSQQSHSQVHMQGTPCVETMSATLKKPAPMNVVETGFAEMRAAPPAPPVKTEASRQKYSAHMSAKLFDEEPPDPRPPRASPDVNQMSLSSVREAMAVSLTRMRELEEQTKAIPILQVRISVLKEEKRLLNLQLKANEAKLKTPPPTLPKPRKTSSVGVGDHSVTEPYNLPSGFVLIENETLTELRSTMVSETVQSVSRAPSLNMSFQQQQQHQQQSSREVSPLEASTHFTINQIQRSAPKALTRSVGVGENNVHESSMQVHEKELTTVFFGQDSKHAKRNVGIECKPPTRDVGVSFKNEEEKPETRTIGVNVNYDTSGVHTSLDFKGETELKTALKNVLQRNVKSVATTCDLRAETADNATVMDVQAGTNVGCGDEENRTDVEIRMPVQRKNVSMEVKPETTSKYTGTNKDWMTNSGTNTEALDQYHKASMTDTKRTVSSSSNTEATATKSETNQTETKMFLAMDQLKHQAVNTQKLSTASAGVATDTVRSFSTAVNTTELVTDLFRKAPQLSNFGSNTEPADVTSAASNTEIKEMLSFGSNTEITKVLSAGINTEAPQVYSAGINTEAPEVFAAGSNTEATVTLSAGTATDVSEVSSRSSNTTEQVSDLFKKAPEQQHAWSNTDITDTLSTGIVTDITPVSHVSVATDKASVKHAFVATEVASVRHTSMATDVKSVSNVSVNTTENKPEKQECQKCAEAPMKPELVDIGVGEDMVEEPYMFSETVEITHPIQKTLTSTEEIIQRGASQANVFLSQSKVQPVQEDIMRSAGSQANYSQSRQQPAEEQMQSSAYEESFSFAQSGQQSGYEQSIAQSGNQSSEDQWQSSGYEQSIAQSGNQLSEDQWQSSGYEQSIAQSGNQSSEEQWQSSGYEQSIAQSGNQSSEGQWQSSGYEQSFAQSQSRSSGASSPSGSEGGVTFIEETFIIKTGEDPLLVTKECIKSPHSPNVNSEHFIKFSDTQSPEVKNESYNKIFSSSGSSSSSQVVESSSSTSSSSFNSSSQSSTNSSSIPQDAASDMSYSTVLVTNPYKTVENLATASSESPPQQSRQMTKTSRTASEGNLYIDQKALARSALRQSLDLDTIYDLRRTGSVEDFMPDDMRKYMSIDPSTSKDSGFGEDLLQRFAEQAQSSSSQSSCPPSLPDSAPPSASDKVRSAKTMTVTKKVITKKVTRSGSGGSHMVVTETEMGTGPDGEVRYSFTETEDGKPEESPTDVPADSMTFAQHLDTLSRVGKAKSSLDNQTHASLDKPTVQPKSILKKKKTESPATERRGITFAESVIGGGDISATAEFIYRGTGSSSEGEQSDSEEEGEEDQEEEEEVEEEEEGEGSDTLSEDSFEEGSYDSQDGAVVYSCRDDEAIARGLPGAHMFDQNIRETYELSVALQEACSTLATYLIDSTTIQTKQLNASLTVIQSEWFSVSSHKLSEMHQVEDFLSSVNEISKRLLEYIVNMTDANGNTAIHYCISHCNFEIASLLMDTDICDINKQNKAGYTPIMLAGLATLQNLDQLDIVKRLFSTGDINARATATEQTALMLAASHGRGETVALLCECGADVNVQDVDGSTALMCACEHGHLEIVNFLLTQPSTNAGLTDNEGSTALTIAMEAGHKDVGVALYKHLNFPSKTPTSPGAHRKGRKSSSSPTPSL